MIILVLLVAVGPHPWTEAHDMNKSLNRTCEVGTSTSLPDYPLAWDSQGLSYPAGGLVSGRPFFCGGKSKYQVYIFFQMQRVLTNFSKNLSLKRYVPRAHLLLNANDNMLYLKIF